MQKYNGLPVFEVDFNDESLWENISIVDLPAIERNFIKLAKTAEVKFSVNEEKREITGPVLLPDQLVYRRDAAGKEFYIKFTKDIIKKMAIEFFKRDTQNNGNVMHQVDVDGITFFESYLLNKERGLCPKEFEDLPDGSWLVTAKVDNEDVWNLIKEGELKGFSISVVADFKEEKIVESLEELLDYLTKD